MNRIYILASIAIAALTLQGCAFNPQQANLAPSLNIAASTEGKNIPIGIRVIDDRPSKSLGRRSNGMIQAAEITAAQDLAVVVKQQLMDGLRKKGFDPVEFNEKNKTNLTFEIRLLEYSTSQGFFTGGVEVKGAIKAHATHASDNYDHMYRSDEEERVIIVPTAESNEKLINTSLSELLNKILEDTSLIKFLEG